MTNCLHGRVSSIPYSLFAIEIREIGKLSDHEQV